VRIEKLRVCDVVGGGVFVAAGLAWRGFIDSISTTPATSVAYACANTRTGKPLEYPWVFAGSGFWVDETTGEKSYLAESGDFICVSNFPSAMLDLPVASSPMAVLGMHANTPPPQLPRKVRVCEERAWAVRRELTTERTNKNV
jgi:hypothetical protein